MKITNLLLLLTCITVINTNVIAEDIPTLDGRQISVDKIEAKIKEANASTSMNEDAKSKIIEIYRKTISFLKQNASDKDSLLSFKDAQNNAHKNAEIIFQNLENRKSNPPKDNTNQYKEEPLSELDQRLNIEIMLF